MLREYPFPRPHRDNPFFKAVSNDMTLHSFSLNEAITRALTSIEDVFSDEHLSTALDFSTVQDALVFCLHMTTAYGGGGGDAFAWHLVSTIKVVLKPAVKLYPTADVALLSCMCIAFSPRNYVNHAEWYYGNLLRAVVVQTECFLELHDDVVCGVLYVAVGYQFVDDVFHRVLEKIMCRRPRAFALAMATCSDALRPVHELFLVRLVRMSQERQEELADVQDIVQGMVARVTGSNCLLDQDLVDAGVLTWVDAMAFPTKALLLANLSATLPDCPAVVKVGRAVLAPTFGRILSRALCTGKCSQAPVGAKAATVQFFRNVSTNHWPSQPLLSSDVVLAAASLAATTGVTTFIAENLVFMVASMLCVAPEAVLDSVFQNEAVAAALQRVVEKRLQCVSSVEERLLAGVRRVLRLPRSYRMHFVDSIFARPSALPHSTVSVALNTARTCGAHIDIRPCVEEWLEANIDHLVEKDNWDTLIRDHGTFRMVDFIHKRQFQRNVFDRYLFHNAAKERARLLYNRWSPIRREWISACVT